MWRKVWQGFVRYKVVCAEPCTKVHWECAPMNANLEIDQEFELASRAPPIDLEITVESEYPCGIDLISQVNETGVC